MPRYLIDVEYDGTPFRGWQRQPDAPTVQEVLECALHAFTHEAPRIQGAGRTDRGVHALAQTAHFDLNTATLGPERMREAFNAHLRPLPVSVLNCRRVAADFDARFSARHRHYRYDILMRPAPPALGRHRSWHIRTPLDLNAMREAALHLLGRHDFTTFRAGRCQALSPIRTLDRFELVVAGEMLHIFCSARSFLHTQVRSMVGCLVLVGRGRWTSDDFRAALTARERRACKLIAPPRGLYLIAVDYAEASDSE